jgi:hypothetical protein
MIARITTSLRRTNAGQTRVTLEDSTTLYFGKVQEAEVVPKPGRIRAVALQSALEETQGQIFPVRELSRSATLTRATFVDENSGANKTCGWKGHK